MRISDWSSDVCSSDLIIGSDHAFHEKLPYLFPHADTKSWFDGNQPLIDTTALRNSSLQGAYLMLAARAMGLDCGPMSGFDNGKVDAAVFAGPAIRSNFLNNLGSGSPDADLKRGGSGKRGSGGVNH